MSELISTLLELNKAFENTAKKLIEFSKTPEGQQLRQGITDKLSKIQTTKEEIEAFQRVGEESEKPLSEKLSSFR